jgi:SAM-dependent methyltransferase
MRARLRRVSPEVPAYEGTAEEIPLPDASVDAVVAGQAYHWFDPERAHPEIARVLRPGGVFAGFWNDADLDVAWTVRLVEIVDGPDAVVRDRTPPDFGDRFGPVTTGRFRHDLWLTADELVGMVTTRSPYLVGTPEQQELLVSQVRELLAANPALVGRFAMPHVTRVHRAVRV